VSPSERRERLVEWLRRVDRPSPSRLTAREIADCVVEIWSPLYVGNKRYARCRADLRYLEREGRVRRHRGPDPEGRPHVWEVIR
jgi:hypothetical protein